MKKMLIKAKMPSYMQSRKRDAEPEETEEVQKVEEVDTRRKTPLEKIFKAAIIKKLKMFGLNAKKTRDNNDEIEPKDYTEMREALANSFTYDEITTIIDRMEEGPIQESRWYKKNA